MDNGDQEREEREETNLDLDLDLSSLLPDEVLEFILSLASPYGELRAARQVNRRWQQCAHRVMLRRSRAMVRATSDMKLRWKRAGRMAANVAAILPNSNKPAPVIQISKRYSHSACYDDVTLSMFVFGGCTCTSSTFNDLWRLDMTNRTWSRPAATGSYPSPKACAVLVLHEPSHSLLLFGGWTHPSLYPLHQSWRLFNELHQYDIDQARWTQLLPSSSVKPPSMAGHSATIHKNGNDDLMVVFGGLHKLRNSIGQFSSSSDVWCFNLTTHCWVQCDIPEPRPTPRYGQSQLWLSDTHMLILGGCGGPNNIFNDVWLLDMTSGAPAANVGGGGGIANNGNAALNQGGSASAPHWRWFKCRVENAEASGASHMWCHPAVRVGDYAVVLGKTRSSNATGSNHDKSSSGHHGKGARGLSDSDTAQFNVIPHLRRGINRGYGAIRRQNTTERYQQQQQQQQQQRRYSDSGSDMDTSSPGGNNEEENSDGHLDISVEPVGDDGVAGAAATAAAAGNSSKTYKTSVTLNVNQSESSHGVIPKQQSLDSPGPSNASTGRLPRQASLPGPSALPRAPPEMARLQAFTSGAPSTYTSSSSLGAVPKNPAKQLETRQKQLDTLKKMEERIKGLNSSSDKSGGSSQKTKPNVDDDERQRRRSGSTGKGCTCHRLSTFILDISKAVSDHEVTWVDLRTDQADLHLAPEETILYTLVRGRSELVMFGGIQKDVSTMTNRTSMASDADHISNSVYYLVPPKDII